MAHRTFIAALVLLVTRLASAQEAIEQPLDAFLEQRGAEELAAHGALLSRRSLVLHVETTSDTIVVELRSPDGRSVAGTETHRVRGDREVAVDQVAQIAMALVTQLPRPAAPPSMTLPIPSAVVRSPPVVDDAYVSRRNRGVAGLVGGIAATGLGVYVLTRDSDNVPPCLPTQRTSVPCQGSGGNDRTSQLLGSGLIVGGAVAAIVGFSYVLAPVPYPDGGGVTVAGHF